MSAIDAATILAVGAIAAFAVGLSEVGLFLTFAAVVVLAWMALDHYNGGPARREAARRNSRRK